MAFRMSKGMKSTGKGKGAVRSTMSPVFRPGKRAKSRRGRRR